MSAAAALCAASIRDAPDESTVEVTVLARLSGECVVVHVGSGKWLVVDSFASPTPSTGHKRQTPIAVRYLRDCLSLDTNDCVEAIALTHFHADHYGAFYELVLACGSAEVTFTPALDAHVLTRLAKISPGLASVKDAYVYAADNNRLRLDGQVRWSQTLAPAVPAQSRASRSVLALLEQGQLEDARALADKQNYTSLVLFLDLDGVRVLLGGDLDDDDPEMGWWKAAEAFRSNGDPQPDGLATYLKVPHHGSKRAHNADALKAMTDRPVAVVAARPGNSLPDPDTLTSLEQELLASVHVSHRYSMPPMNNLGVRSGAMLDDNPHSVRIIRSRWDRDAGMWSVARSDDFESIVPTSTRDEGG